MGWLPPYDPHRGWRGRNPDPPRPCWTDRFPGIRDAAKALPVRRALIDGEAVVEIDGIPNFSALQAALGAREGPKHKAAHEAVLYAFDLLHLNGVDLQPAPLLKRKAALKEIIGAAGPIRYSEHLPADEGEALFRQSCIMGLEGVISKRADRPYRSGRGDEWFKIKFVNAQEYYLPELARILRAKADFGLPSKPAING